MAFTPPRRIQADDVRFWAVRPEAIADLLNRELYDQMKAGFPTNAVYVPYKTLWTAVTTDPVIGNGTITGSYIQLGTMVTAKVRIVMGSTTTFGSGVWSIRLPRDAASAFTDIGSLWGLDTGSVFRVGVVRVETIVTVRMHSEGASAEWSSTEPHTWANGDELAFTITYEAA